MAGVNEALRQAQHARYAAARERFKERLRLNQAAVVCHSEPGSFVITGCGCDGCACALPAVEGGAVDAPPVRVAGVRFRDSGKTYYVSADSQQLSVGQRVIVDTSRGREIGQVVIAPQQIVANQLEGELRPIVRVATEDDLRLAEVMRGRHGEAIQIFTAKIRDHNLPMKPISAEYTFDGSRLTIYFSANGRVDFRELVRDLAGHFHCRIELRQIGPRDEARLLGGLGRCGRPLCCSTWLPQFADISMTMAKTQDLSTNPGKVSGVCGKLLCCLSYENDIYAESRNKLPRLGQEVDTEQGRGYVAALHILKELVTIKLDSGEELQLAPDQLTALGGTSENAPRRRRIRRDSAEG